MRKNCLKALAILQTFTLAGTVYGAVEANVVPDVLRTRAQKLMGSLPDKMPGSEKDTPARVELGKKLFFETRLSQDQKMTCNTCHQVEGRKGGVDNEATSLGVVGKRGGRNSPTVLNAGFQLSQFWDGRAATLEDQAKGPILNPVEMAMPDEKVVMKRLSADAEYPALFKKAFSEDTDPLTYDNLARAIAAYERTLITHDRFDDFLKGDDKALTSQELQGLSLYLKTGCATCHNGPTLGGNRYHKLGQAHSYANQSDMGRYDVTKVEADKLKFKTPVLRNVALTAPYYHDGKILALADAVTDMAWLQLDKKLEADETAAIEAFLKSLTDKDRETK
jgi:cytochrome c peroxidase